MGLLFLWASVLCAAPVNGVFKYNQPDGNTLQVWVVGDELFAEEQTLDGWHIIQDPVSKFWCYARLSEDGESLESTGIIARDVEQGSGKVKNALEHERLKIPKEYRKRIAEANRARLGRDASGRFMLRQNRSESSPSLNGVPTDAEIEKVISGGPTLGKIKGLTILVRFPDRPQDVTLTRRQVDNFCNQMSPHYTEFGNNGSVTEYFYDISNGNLNYTNIVVDYYEARNKQSYYTDPSVNFGVRARELIWGALDALEAANFDFRTVDADGDGVIDAVNCFYAGDLSNSWGQGLWPHASWVNWTSAKTGKSARCYQISNIGTGMSISGFCHENGHMLCGFPDIYDYHYDSTGGAGRFCLMDIGGCFGLIPPCGYLRYKAGWGTTETITASTHATKTITAETSDGRLANQFLIYVNPANSKEYFLLENRYQHGLDARLPTGGIAVWHVDEQASTDIPDWTHNSTHRNYEVVLIQADSQRELERNIGMGDDNDLFYAGNPAQGYSNQFSDMSDPGLYDNNAHWWNGTPSGLKLSSFSAPGNTMSLVVGQLSPTVGIITIPASVTITVGATRQFNAYITGTTNIAVTWSCKQGKETKNLVNSKGLFTAPATGGTFIVTATSVADPSKSASATVTVISRDYDGGTNPYYEIESNDSFSAANIVPYTAMVIVGNLDSRTDQDNFKVEVGAGATLTVNMTGPSDKDYDLLIHDSSGTYLTCNLTKTSTERLTYTNTSSADVTIIVHVESDKGDCTSTIPYTLELCRTNSGALSVVSVTEPSR